MAGKPAKDGGDDGKQKQSNTMDNYIAKGTGMMAKSSSNFTKKDQKDKNEVQITAVTQGEMMDNMNEMNEHWENVIKGPSGALVAIKEEIVTDTNQFEVLSEKDNEEDNATGNNSNIVNGSDEDITQYKRISTDELMEMNIEEVEKMEIAALSEHVFKYMRCKNPSLERRHIYLKQVTWLQNTLRTAIKKVQTEEFLKYMDKLASTLKMMDLEANDNEEGMKRLLKQIYTASQCNQDMEKVNARGPLEKIRSTIYLIEAYVNNPMTMIPKETFLLCSCDKDDILKQDYFTVVMAIIAAKARVGNALEKGMEDLRSEANELHRLYMKDKGNKEEINRTPSKKSRTAKSIVTPLKNQEEEQNKDENGNMEVDDKQQNTNHNPNEFRDGPTDAEMIQVHDEAEKQVEKKKEEHIAIQTTLVKAGLAKKKSQLEQNMEKVRADRREQAQNLNGQNIDNIIPTEHVTGPTFEFPEGKKVVNHIMKEKTVYYLHQKIHVENNKKVHVHEIVKMIFRVLRKADPTVVLLPFKKEQSTMNATIDKEDQIPSEESEIKKWIGIATIQPYQKFAFSIRVNLTEEPQVVKGRIFNWCRDRKHYIEFKQITSANIFFAGWLYRIHKQYHNREELRNWMVKGNETLKHEIHLAPAQIFKLKGDELGTKAITTGLRVEASFEKREEILKALYNLEWEQGPYKQSIFVPYRENEEYTKEMLLQLIEGQNSYIASVEQRVFKMKGAQWQIKKITNEDVTTFQKWLEATVINGKKIIESVEVGDNDYVRLIYKSENRQYIQHIMRHIHQTTTDTFGAEITSKLFPVMHGVRNGAMHEMEENHAKKIQKLLGGNPQMDDCDVKRVKPPPRRPRQTNVSFQSDVNETYATIAKNSTTSVTTPKTGQQVETKNIDDLKDEILKKVKEDVDSKLDGLERKVDKKLNTMKMEQDAKIDSLSTLVKDTHKKSELAAEKRDEALTQKFEANNQNLIATLTALFTNNGNTPQTNIVNPPIPTVEKDSCAGGSQE